jgi:hypothetical protein
MLTRLVDDVEPLSVDSALLRHLQASSAPAVQSGIGMSIGIEGPTHRVYRVIDIDNLIEAIEVFEMLQVLGFTIDGGREENGRVLQRVFRATSAELSVTST